LVELLPSDPEPHTLSLVAGLALIEALDVGAPGQPLMLKWPNDVLLNGKKLAGILLERSGDRVAVGFGVNLASAPQLTGRPSACLGGASSPETFAPLVAGSFARLLQLWRQREPGMLARAWLARAHPIGSRLRVHSTADEWVAGRFDGIEADGALRLRRDDGTIDIVRAGDVDL
jgi:BirA family biotin operon repressor/biotin-[acetyl-CoA-carboxylase] ligase